MEIRWHKYYTFSFVRDGESVVVVVRDTGNNNGKDMRVMDGHVIQ